MPSPLTDPAQLRVDYKRAALDEQAADPDPFRQFARWFDEASSNQRANCRKGSGSAACSSSAAR
ncbi:MAG: hypothetical protein KGL70_03285, partial [Betaproteobacteria bacterium]|nr:hypothetical protein [Betaproteobacteria bacterium]